MNLYEFEYGLSEMIIDKYINAKEEYEDDIEMLERYLDPFNIDLNRSIYEKNLKKALEEREKLIKIINALKTRHKTKPVYYYTNLAKYKVIGEINDFNEVHNGLDSLRYLEQKRIEIIRSLKFNRKKHGTSLVGTWNNKKLRNKLHKLKRKTGKVQNIQREVVLDKVNYIGVKEYGLPDYYRRSQDYYEYYVPEQKPKIMRPINKPTISDKIKKFKNAVIVGFYEFKDNLKQEEQTYTKKH